jgi:hypothetical protein
MNIENHVTSIELSRQLREMGIEQKALCMWDYEGKLRVGITTPIHPHYKTAYPDEITVEAEGCFSAFMLHELLEVINNTNNAFVFDFMRPTGKTWFLKLGIITDQIPYEKHKNPAEAAGRLLLYLKQKGVI